MASGKTIMQMLISQSKNNNGNFAMSIKKNIISINNRRFVRVCICMCINMFLMNKLRSGLFYAKREETA